MLRHIAQLSQTLTLHGNPLHDGIGSHGVFAPGFFISANQHLVCSFQI